MENRVSVFKRMSQFIVALGLVVLVLPAIAVEPADRGKVLTEACAACHAVDGNSLAPAFPKLAGQGEKYLLKQLNDIKSGARSVPQMAGQLDKLSKADLASIAAYYSSQKMTLSGVKDDKELLALGRKIYMAGNKEAGVPACSGCHSPTGFGIPQGGFPKLGGQYADYIAKQLNDFRTGAEYTDKGRHNDNESIMREGVKRMSEREIEAVANYISGLH